MEETPGCIIIRHTRENLKKCSLEPLRSRKDLHFFTYPECVQGKETLPDLSSWLLLDIDGPPLSSRDRGRGIIIIDATWRLAEKIVSQVKPLHAVEKRSMPEGFLTAYPRRQEDCPDPEKGLASLEALFIAYRILGIDTTGLLDHYYWKEAFLEKNQELFGCMVPDVA